MKHASVFILTATLLAGLSLAACSTADQEGLNKTVADAAQPWNGPPWWTAFHDPLIDRLADQVLAQNIDVKIAATRLAAARSQTDIVTAGLYPDLSATGSEIRQKTQFYPTPQTLGQAGLNLNWDLDVFGQTRAGIHASDARANSLDANVDDMRNLVIADLVKAVIDWRQASATVRETNILLHSQDEQVRLLTDRAKAGLIDTSFAQRAKAERAQTATQLPQALAARQAAQYQMERLVDDTHTQVEAVLTAAAPSSINLPAPDQSLAISMDTLKNRPDLRAARFNLLAAEADLDQAEANLWPKISVSVFFGLDSATNGIRLGSNPFWSIGSSLTTPILNFGRLSGAVDAANAGAKQAAYSYENTALQAVQETKTALSDYLNGLNRVTAQRDALNRRRDTVAIVKERFQRGLTDMTDLTTAQTELDQATLALITAQTATAEAFIRFEKALGGSARTR